MKASSILTQEDTALYVGVRFPLVAVVVHLPRLPHSSTERLDTLRRINVAWLNKNLCAVVLDCRLAVDLNWAGAHVVILVFFSSSSWSHCSPSRSFAQCSSQVTSVEKER